MRRYWLNSGYALLLGLLFLAQLFLGGSILMISALILVACLGFIPLISRDFYVIDGLYFILVQYHATACLLFKSILGQAVQKNLLSSDTSSLYLLIGFLSITAGYLAARRLMLPIPVMKRMEAAFNTRSFERLFAKGVFVVGVTFFMLHYLFRAGVVEGSANEGGFGGFGFFFFLLPMAWVMQMALCARDPRNRTERLTLYAMAAMTLALAFGGNVKVVFIQFIITLAVCILAFGIRIRPRVAAALALLAIGLVLYVQPIVQITRVKAAQLSPIERVNEAGATLAEADYNPARLLEKASEVARTYKLSYAGSYVYPATWNVDRFQMIFPIDEVARALPTVGTIGIGPTVTEIIEVTLPSVFIRKTNISTPDVIGWHFGFRTNGAITRPVVGLLASSLATYGLLGVALLPGLVILVGFSIINLMAGKMQGNPWAAFVFMNFLPIVEKEIAPFLVIYTHLLPYVLLTCAIMWLIWASRYRQAAVRINQFQGRRRHDAAPL